MKKIIVIAALIGCFFNSRAQVVLNCYLPKYSSSYVGNTHTYTIQSYYLSIKGDTNTPMLRFQCSGNFVDSFPNTYGVEQMDTALINHMTIYIRKLHGKIMNPDSAINYIVGQ